MGQKKHTIGLWGSQRDFEKGKSADQEIDLLKVVSVQPDVQQQSMFVVNYFDQNKAPQRCVFERVDRGTEVWIELFQLLIKTVREKKDEKSKDKKEKKEKKDKKSKQ